MPKLSESRLALILIIVVAFNTAMLGVITYKGVEYRSILRRRSEGMRAVSSVLSGIAPVQPLGERLGAVMGTLMGEFILGSFNGSIPAFIQNVATTDFSSIASSVSGWAASVNQTFGNNNCADVVCSRANQRVECRGQTFWCNAAGEIIPCSQGSTGCVAQGLTTAAAAIKSVSDKIIGWVPPVGPATTPAAMSNGIFRLDVIFSWFQAQFNFPSWVSAAQTVSNFVANMRRIDFSGCARDSSDERSLCWNINTEVTTILDAINQVSQALAPPTVPSIYTDTLSSRPSFVPHAELEPRQTARSVSRDFTAVNSQVLPSSSVSTSKQSDPHYDVTIAAAAGLTGLVVGLIAAVSVMRYRKIALRRGNVAAPSSRSLPLK